MLGELDCCGWGGCCGPVGDPGWGVPPAAHAPLWQLSTLKLIAWVGN